MTYTVPPKLKQGQHIRVVAPSRSAAFVDAASLKNAQARLEKLGVTVSFSRNAFEKDSFNSSSIRSRLDDLHEAFADPEIHAIMTVIGGYTANQLLDGLDYELIRSNPKILCGFSDISVLANAITAKTGVITYIGPHFSSFGMEKGFEFTEQNFMKCLWEAAPVDLAASPDWSDDPWFLNQQDRTFLPNSGYWNINSVPGTYQGRLWGGHQGGFSSLQGTSYWPPLMDSILLLEDTAATNLETFERRLTSISQQPDFNRVKALVIGRFQKESQVQEGRLKDILAINPRLAGMPIVANVDFGHTTPILTLPIGGMARLKVSKTGSALSLLSH